MDEQDMEGSEVLEKVAAIDEVETFMQAVDLEDLARAKTLMKRAGIDATAIATVLRKIATGED